MPDPAFTDWLIDQELGEAETSLAAPSYDYGAPRSGRRMLPCPTDQDGVL